MNTADRANFVRNRMEERQAQGFSRLEAHRYAVAMLAQAEANEPPVVPVKQPLHQHATVPDGWPDAHILVDFYQRMKLPTDEWECAGWEELEDDDLRYWGDDESFPLHKVWIGSIGYKQYIIRQGYTGKGWDDDIYEYEEVQE